MASTFLKDNFKSLNEEEKKKAMAKAAAEQAANTMRKSLTDKAAGELEVAFIEDAIGSDVAKIKKLLEEEDK